MEEAGRDFDYSAFLPSRPPFASLRCGATVGTNVPMFEISNGVAVVQEDILKILAHYADIRSPRCPLTTPYTRNHSLLTVL